MKTKNMLKKIGLIVGVGALSAVSYNAQALTVVDFFTSSSPGVQNATGSLTLSGSSGSVNAIAGNLVVSGVSGTLAVYNGTYNLLAGSGNFGWNSNIGAYDDLVNLAAPVGTGSVLSQFEVGGLAFIGTGAITGDEIVISGLGNDSVNYAESGFLSVGTSAGLVNSTFGTYSFSTMSPVPEASSFAIASAGVLGLVFAGRRFMKRQATA